MAKIKLTSHALIRFLERGFDMDFTEMRIEVAVMLSKPSWRHVTDNELVREIETHLDTAPFRERLYQELNGSDIVHEDKVDCFRRLKNGLIAVISKQSRTIRTIVPATYIPKGLNAARKLSSAEMTPSIA